jgi:Icc-related predicted phosphoesterase
MIVAAISDTHGRDGWTIPPCDVFIHAGDMTAGGTVDEQIDVLVWLATQTQARHKILVPGNHDACYEKYGKDLLRNPSIAMPTVLIDEAVTIDGKVFYGSPWTPPFKQWSFMAEEDELNEKYKAMPREVDVLITHGPARGILDVGHKHEHAGSKALLYAIDQREVKHHVFGHIHGEGGRYEKVGYTTRYNVAACDEAYNLRRGCKVIEI